MGTERIEKIELDLPKEIVLFLRSLKPPQIELNEKVTLALAIDLFMQGKISFAKAAEIIGIHRYDFAHLLKERGIPAYEYNIDMYKQDKKVINKYGRKNKKSSK